MRRWIGLLCAAAALVSCQAPERGTAVPREAGADISFVLEAAPGARTRVLPISGVRISTGDDALLTAADVTRVEVAEAELGAGLLFELGASAAERLNDVIRSEPARRLVLLVDGKAVGAIRLAEPIRDRRMLFLLEVAEEALPELARRLDATARRGHR